MLRTTHINFALLVTLPLINLNNYPYLFLSAAAATLPDLDLKLKIKHRTWTHTLIVGLIAATLIYKFDPVGALFFGVGYFSHLFMDTLTVSGVKWFYPFTNMSYRICKVKTGSRLEKLINSFIVVILFFYLLYRFNFFHFQFHQLFHQ